MEAIEILFRVNGKLFLSSHWRVLANGAYEIRIGGGNA